MFEQSYDDILAARLQGYAGQTTLSGEPVDTSKGSLVFIKESVDAAAEWGLHKKLRRVFATRLPTTPDGETPKGWAGIYGVPVDQNAPESKVIIDFLSRVRTPPQGGNQYDYPAWARACSFLHDPGPSAWLERVSAAKIFREPRGPGTLDVAILAVNTSTGAEMVASSDLLTIVFNYINDRRPVTASDFQVLGAVPTPTDLSMTIHSLPTSQQGALRSDIISFMNSTAIATDVPFAQLASICIEHGAMNVTAAFDNLAADPAPPIYPVIRMGAFFPTYVP